MAEESVARVIPRPSKNTIICRTIIFVSSPYIVTSEKMTNGSYCQTKYRMRLGNELSPFHCKEMSTSRRLRNFLIFGIHCYRKLIASTAFSGLMSI